MKFPRGSKQYKNGFEVRKRKKIKKRAEEIKPSTIDQYGKKEGTSAAFAIATDQVLGET